MSKTLPITNLGEKWLKYFESIDCKYIVINLKDMIEALTEQELNDFNEFLEKYNDWRAENKNKDTETLERYFCVKRDDFPEFKDKPALDFWNWIHEVYDLAYGK